MSSTRLLSVVEFIKWDFKIAYVSIMLILCKVSKNWTSCLCYESILAFHIQIFRLIDINLPICSPISPVFASVWAIPLSTGIWSFQVILYYLGFGFLRLLILQFWYIYNTYTIWTWLPEIWAVVLILRSYLLAAYFRHYTKDNKWL